MLNKKVRKALTLVEVLVVVAILAILATVGIVGYSAFVTRSNKSNDATLVTELNHFVKAQNQVKELYTVTDAQVALKKNGFNLENLKPSQKGYRYAYNVEKKDFLIIDKNWKPVDYTEYEHQEDIFAFVSSEKEMNEAMNYSVKGKGDGYSVYLQEDFTYESSNVNHVLEINEGADLGLIVDCTKVNYVNNSDAQTVTMYTPTFGTILNVTGEHDTVKHWGYAGLLNIYKIDSNSFDAYGVYGRVNLYQGHFKAMAGSIVYCIVANEGCFVSIEDGATVYVDGKPYTGSLDRDSKLFVGDIANHVCDHSVRYTIFDNNNEYLVCALCGYTVVKVVWYDKDGFKHEKYVAVNDGDDPVITPYAVYEVDEDDVPTGDGPIDIKDIENKELTDPAKYIPGNDPTCSHSWGALIGTKEKSCTEYGEAYKKCALCGAELHYQIEPTGHKLSKVGGKLATCTAAGYESYYVCDYCSCLFADNTAKILTTKDQKAIKQLGHKFTSPEYTWSGNQCTAERHCTRDGCNLVQKETKPGSFVLDTPATCLKAETGHYQVASTVWENSAFGTSDSTKDSVVGTNGALGHDWGNPSYDWAGNQCTATVKCERDGCNYTITETKTGEFVQDKENTCTEPNKGHYVVRTWDHPDRFAANVSTAANSVTGDLKEKGHTFGTPSYAWNGANCTATAKCTVCQHVETETKAGQFIEDTKATCNDSNKGHYQVSNWDNTKLFETQNSLENSVTGAVGALGHVLGNPSYKWNGKSCTATAKCIHEGCNYSISDTKEGVYQASVGATCTEGGKGYYVVSTWNYAIFSEQKLAVDGTEVKALGHLDVFDDWGNHHCTREGCKELGVKRAHSTEKGKCSCGMINIESLTEMTESGTAAKPVRYKLIKDSELTESITIRCNHAIVYFDNHTVTLSSCGDAKMGIKVTGNDITFLGNGSTKSINSQLSVAAMITEGDNITFQDFYFYSHYTYCLRVKGKNTVIKGNSDFKNVRNWVILPSDVTPTISVEKTLNGERADLTILYGTFFNWSMIIKGDGGCCFIKGGIFNTNRQTLSSIVNFDNRADFAITGGFINVATDYYAQFKDYIDLDIYEPIYDNDLGMYKITEMPVVCEIGQTKYRTFSKAYNEAKPGETIRLVKDITWDGSLDKEISFSGNHTLTCTGQIKAGTFDCKVIANGGIVGGKFNTGVYTVSGLNLDNAKFNTRISGNYIEVFNRVYAKIGTTEYTSFAEAYAAAKDGDTIEILENCYYDGGISKNVTITGSKTLTVQGTISNGYFACGLDARSRIEGGYFAKSIFGDGKGLENGLFRSFSSGNWWHVVRAVASITENNNTTYYEDFASALKDGQGVIITIYGQVSYNGSISDYIGVVGESYDGHDATLTVSGDISNGIYNVRVKAANITGGVYRKKVSVTGQTTGGTFSDDYSHSLNIPSSYFEKDSKIGDSDAFEVCFIAATVEYTTYVGERWVTKTKNYASFAEAYAAADDDEVITLYKNDTYTGNLTKDVEINGNYSLTVKNGVISKGEFNVTVLTDNSKVAGGSFLKSKYNSNMTIDGLYEPVESGNYYNVLLQIRDLYQVSYGTVESRKGTANFNSLEDLKAALDWEYRLGTGNCYNYDGRIVTGISVIKANTISTNISFDHEITITGSALITISSTISNIIFDCPTNLLSNPGTNVKFTSSHKPQLTNLKEYAPALVDGYYKIQGSVCYIGTTGYATFNEAYTIASSGTDKNIVLRTNCTYSGSAALTGITVSGNYTLGVSSAEITGGTYDNAKVTTAARKIKGGKFLNAVEKSSVVAKKVAIVSGGYYQLADAKASVDDVYYYTFEEAYAAAQANQTLTIYVNTSYKGSLSKNITIKGDNNNIVLDIRPTDSISAGTYDCLLVFNASNVTGGKFNKDLISKKQLDHDTTVATLEGNYRVLTTAVAKVGDEYFGTFAEAYEKAKPTSAEITLLGNTSYDGSKGDLDKVTVSGSYTLDVKNCSIVGGTYNSTISIADRKISGGLFKQAIDKSKVVAEYVPVLNKDNYYQIEKADALMNGVYYLTFKEAYEVAGNNDITLIDDCSYDGNLTKNIKISGNYTITLGNTATITAGTYECKLSGYNKNNISKGVKFSKTNFQTSNLDHGKTVAVDNGTYFEMIEAVAVVNSVYYATFGQAVTAAGKTYEIDLLDNISSYSGDVDGITVKSTAGKTLTLSGKVYNSTFKCKVFTSSNNVYEGNTFQIAGSTISLANEPLVIDEQEETGYKLTKKANYKVGNTYYLNMPSDAIAEGKTIVLYANYTYSGNVSVNITVNSDNGSIFEVSGVISSGVYNCNVKASDVQGGSFKISDYNNSNVSLNGYYSKTEYNGMFSVTMLGVCRVVYSSFGNTKYATFNTWKEAYDAVSWSIIRDSYSYNACGVSSIEILKPITISSDLNFAHSITVTGSVKFYVNTTANNVTFNCPVKLLSNPGSSAKFMQKPELWTNTLAAVSNGSYYTITTAVCAVGDTGYATFNEAATVANVNGAGKEIVLFTNCEYTESTSLNYCSVTSTTDASGNYLYGLNVTTAKIGGGTYKVKSVTTANGKINAGSFHCDIAKTQCVDWKVPVKNSTTGVTQVNTAKAKLGNEYYYTFDEAYKAATDGQTITINANTTVSYNLTKNVIYKNNGSYTFKVNDSYGISAGTFDIKVSFNKNNVSGGKFAVSAGYVKSDLDHGTKAATIENSYYVLKDGTCKIGTEYFATFDDAYAVGSGKTITLVAAAKYSGSTALTNITVEGSSYTLTVSNASITGGTYKCTISISGKKISGGSFAQDPKSNLVDKYCSVKNGTMYDVKGAVALMNGTYYYTFADAYAAASDGQTITLYASDSYTSGNLTKNVTISASSTSITLTITSTTKVEKGVYDVVLVNLEKSNISVGVKFKNSYYNATDLNYGSQVAFNDGTRFEIKSAPVIANDTPYATVDEAYKAGYKTIVIYENTTCNTELDGVTISGSFTLTLKATVKNSTFNCLTIAEKAGAGNTFNNKSSTVTPIADVCVKTNTSNLTTVSARFAVKYSSTGSYQYFYDLPSDALTNGVAIKIYQAHTISGNIARDITFESANSAVLTVSGAISKGTYNCEVVSTGTITGGTFNGKVTANNTISSGTFAGEVVATGTNSSISGGTFNGKVTTKTGSVSGGSFKTGLGSTISCKSAYCEDDSTSGYIKVVKGVAKVGSTYYPSFAKAVASNAKSIELLAYQEYSGEVNGITVTTNNDATLKLTGKIVNSKFDCFVTTGTNNVYAGCSFLKNNSASISLANEPLLIVTEGNYQVVKAAKYKVNNTYYVDMPSTAIAAGNTITLYEDYTYGSDISVNVTFAQSSKTLTVNGVISAGTYNCNVKTSNAIGGTFVNSTSSTVGVATYYDKVTGDSTFTVKMTNVVTVYYYSDGWDKTLGKVSTKTYNTIAEAVAWGESREKLIKLEILKPLTISDTFNYNYTFTGSVTLTFNGTVQSGTFECPVVINKAPSSSATFTGTCTINVKDYCRDSNYHVVPISSIECKIGTVMYQKFDDAVKQSGEITLLKSCSYTGSDSLNRTIRTENKDYLLTVTQAKITGGTYDCKITTQSNKIYGGNFAHKIESNSSLLAIRTWTEQVWNGKKFLGIKIYDTVTHNDPYKVTTVNISGKTYYQVSEK